MKVYPPQLEIGEQEGFTPQKDLFGRADLGRQMSSLVATVEDPLVIAFDGVWGSGKTTFLKMWAGELRKAGHPVVFFDAFENDFVDDAFAALARELVELVETHAQGRGDALKERIVKLGSLLLRSSAKVGLKALSRAATAGMANDEDIADAVRDAAAEVEAIADGYMTKLIEAPREQRDTVQNFRDALQALPSLTHPPQNEEENQKPLIFIIDELDRCKPVFALALLERIKHFMSVPNVHFVLGTHLEQLKNSVRYAYGGEIDATLYLQKFINITLFLEASNRPGDGDLDRFARSLVTELGIQNHVDNSVSTSIESIIRISRYHGLSLRTVERAFTLLSISLAFTPERQLKIGPIMGGLIMMKLLNPKIFKSAKNKHLRSEDIFDFLGLSEDLLDDDRIEWERNWWKFVSDEHLEAELEGFARETLARYAFRNRRDILSYMANDVVDRIAPPAQT
ncbi:KAP family P-loop NTPase fold protein [Stappia sp.]|uniref:KAP family P-loop NTPase fold protein n=1 Tax=Stappia sp. TaxID=1870903 RepID=UPI003C7EA2D8